MSERGAKLYLADIVNALGKIENYTRNFSFEKFSANDQVIDAVVRNFEIIGEAARNMPHEIISANPEIPWEKMVGMRNKVIHEYFSVDEEIVWKTIREDLVGLKEQIAKIVNGAK